MSEFSRRLAADTFRQIAILEEDGLVDPGTSEKIGLLVTVEVQGAVEEVYAQFTGEEWLKEYVLDLLLDRGWWDRYEVKGGVIRSV